MILTEKNIETMLKEKVLLENVNTTLDKINYALDQDQISEAIIELAVTMREEGFQKAVKEMREILINTRLVL